MKTILKLSFLLLALLLPATASAYDFEVDGIYYNINGNEATVTYKGSDPGSDPAYNGNVVIPSTVTYNGTTYSVTSIGSSAFYCCSGLTSIDIPNSVTSIGEYAFEYCSGLTNITIPNSVTTIGDVAFYECSGLTSITIPNSVTSIGIYAFTGCSSGLTSIEVESSNPYYDSRNNCNAIIETASNTLIIGCKNTTIPNSVTSIGYTAFYSCTGLTNIEIPNSVTTIGDDAFSACTGLTSITIPNSVTSIQWGAFKGCSGLTVVNITDIEAWCRIHFIYAPEEGATSNPLINAHHLYLNGSEVTDLVIPNSITKINAGAFAGCSGLVSVSIPNSVKIIDYGAFSECTGLSSIDIPSSVTTIGVEAFYGCTGLTSITIPNSVNSIGYETFYRCSNLNDVYSYIIDPTPISMGSYVFYRYPNNYTERTLHVPYGTSELYQTDTKWSQYFGSIVEMDPVLAESIQLNVTTAGLNEGSSLQLTATVLPEECNSKTVLWASNNPSVATVDSNGLVTTHGIGTATITAVTTDGSNLSTSCTVTLLPVGVKGDVNTDGNINITDVTTLINYLLSGHF